MAKSFQGFPEGTFQFLNGITRNNNKAWFDNHRDDYQAYYVDAARSFVEALGPRLSKLSPTLKYEASINGSLFRINRDVRFSKDRRPYKNHIDLWFWHGDRRGWDSPGFFFRMFADRLILGAGMHKFEKAQFDAYRNAAVDDRSGKALVKALAKVTAAGPYTIGQATRKTVPRGFDANHERAALLLHEGLTAEYDGAIDKSAGTTRFVDVCIGHFKAVWPVARWLLDEVVAGTPRARS